MKSIEKDVGPKWTGQSGRHPVVDAHSEQKAKRKTQELMKSSAKKKKKRKIRGKARSSKKRGGA